MNNKYDKISLVYGRKKKVVLKYIYLKYIRLFFYYKLNLFDFIFMVCCYIFKIKENKFCYIVKFKINMRYNRYYFEKWGVFILWGDFYSY